MKLLQWIPCLLAVLLSGCGPNRSPQFVTRDGVKKLIGDARASLEGTLNEGFGTPNDLVAWKAMPLDFGSFSGEVAALGSTPGTVEVELKSDEGSLLATESRLHDLAGAAVVVKGHTGILRVGNYEIDDSANPKVHRLQIVDESGANANVSLTKGDVVTVVGSGLQNGRDLYLRHCMHCHGVSGDGAGSTAQYLNPVPRDYRDGVIKFTSTNRGLGPNRNDIYRIIKLGAPGTYMPSFMLLADDDVRAISEYVRFLAMRGQVEALVLNALKGDFAIEDKDTSETLATKQTAFATFLKDEFQGVLTESTEIITDGWKQTDDPESVIMPKDGRQKLDVSSAEFKESLKIGRQLFMDSKNKCAGCHGEKGRGDGASTEDHVVLDGVTAKEPGYFDAWGNRVTPRNLTQGMFRGGRRPIDIYRRIRIGIKGTPMPGNTDMTDEQVWHLVNYVLNIQFEDRQVLEKLAPH